MNSRMRMLLVALALCCAPVLSRAATDIPAFPASPGWRASSGLSSRGRRLPRAALICVLTENGPEGSDWVDERQLVEAL